MKGAILEGKRGKTSNIEELTKAIYSVNKHAKVATDNQYLYFLKREAIEKLLSEGKAEKIGLHFSPNPGKVRQRSDTLVRVDKYYFHIPPTQFDVANLPHLGERDPNIRNIKSHMSVRSAKKILERFIGHEPNKPNTSASAIPTRSITNKQKKKRRHRVDNQLRSKNTFLN